MELQIHKSLILIMSTIQPQNICVLWRIIRTSNRQNINIIRRRAKCFPCSGTNLCIAVGTIQKSRVKCSNRICTNVKIQWNSSDSSWCTNIGINDIVARCKSINRRCNLTKVDRIGFGNLKPGVSLRSIVLNLFQGVLYIRTYGHSFGYITLDFIGHTVNHLTIQ